MSRFLTVVAQKVAMILGLTVVAFLVHENIGHTQDGNLLDRAWQFLLNSLSGDLGYRINGQPLLAEFVERLPASLTLLVLATVAAWLIGLPLAIIFAAQRYQKRRRTSELVTGILMSLPVFWIAQILLMTLAVGTGWFPVGGELTWAYEVPRITGVAFIDALISDTPHKWEVFGNAAEHLILPVVVMAMAPTAYLFQEFGAQMERIGQLPFILVAKARGISQRQLIWRHLLPNAMHPVLKGLQVQFALLVSNLIIVETLFLWPGIGSWLVDLARNQEIQAIPGVILLFGVFVLVLNSITQVIQYFWDPDKKL